MSFVAPGLTAEHIEKYQFDEFELLPTPRVLLRAGLRILLTPKPFDTLLMLVERAGQTVFKEELFAQVWSGAEVEENNLTQSISTLRKVLGEKRGENRYIVTDPGRGYRFVAPGSHFGGEDVAGANEILPQLGSRWWPKWWTWERDRAGEPLNAWDDARHRRARS